MHVDNSSSASNSVGALWTITEIHLLPDIILGACNIALNQTDKSPCLQVTYIITGEEFNSIERERSSKYLNEKYRYKVSPVQIGLPQWFSGQRICLQCRRQKRCGFDLWVRKISWRKRWQLQCSCLKNLMDRERSLVGYRP